MLEAPQTEELLAMLMVRDACDLMGFCNGLRYCGDKMRRAYSSKPLTISEYEYVWHGGERNRFLKATLSYILFILQF